jgi:trimeric autotransporter adhesin
MAAQDNQGDVTAVGALAATSNTTGFTLTAIGANALRDNTTGYANTAVGQSAAQSNTTGIENTALGRSALVTNTTGSSNVALGVRALNANTTASNNTAIGSDALNANTTGAQNTAVGFGALLCNTTASSNTAVGFQALCATTTSAANVAVGEFSILSNTTGGNNTAQGWASLCSNTTGSCSVAIGATALFSNTTGNNNIGIGIHAGRTGCSPLAITTANNQVVIGNNNHDCFVAGCAWVTSSDCRDKADVGGTSYGLNFVLALQPVEYKWDKRSKYGWNEETQSYIEGDGSQKDARCSIGFLAQQVLEVEKQFAPNRNSIIVSDDDPLSLNMGETRIIPALVKAIQELTARVEQLENA